MKWLKQHWRGTLRLFSAGLLCVSAFFGYWWSYKLGPSRRTLDPQWRAAHSEREYWRQVQKSIHRGIWFHDAGFTVGWYGDKAWAEWIMAYVRPGTGMGCLGGRPLHSADAMRYITNQDVGETANAWLNWWEKNKSKAQEEWFADGFRQRGFMVDIPPVPEQIPVLIAILGNPEADEPTGNSKEMRYNAFRCLRDSGFEPVAFALANRPASAEVERGLLKYAKMERSWPVAAGVGILPFGKQDDDWSDPPVMLAVRFRAAAYALVFGPLLLGAALAAWSLRRKPKTVEPLGPAYEAQEH